MIWKGKGMREAIHFELPKAYAMKSYGMVIRKSLEAKYVLGTIRN